MTQNEKEILLLASDMNFKSMLAIIESVPRSKVIYTAILQQTLQIITFGLYKNAKLSQSLYKVQPPRLPILTSYEQTEVNH